MVWATNNGANNDAAMTMATVATEIQQAISSKCNIRQCNRAKLDCCFFNFLLILFPHLHTHHICIMTSASFEVVFLFCFVFAVVGWLIVFFVCH